jgi:hypothetical protein
VEFLNVKPSHIASPLAGIVATLEVLSVVIARVHVPAVPTALDVI